MEKWRHGDVETWRHTDMDTWIWRHGDIKRKTEAQAIFLNPSTSCSLCKQKFLVCPFVDEETHKSYPFANGLNRLNGLAHLWYIYVFYYRGIYLLSSVTDKIVI
jgi:hypothetical protein